MIVTQSFETSLNSAGNPLVIGGYVYAQKTNAGVAIGTLSVNRDLLTPNAELSTGSVSGYLSISQVSQGPFNLNALSIDTDLAALNRTYFFGYRDGVQVISGSSADLLNVGLLGDTRYSFGTGWENLTEVRIYNASVLNVSLGQLGFEIDDVTTTDVTLPGVPTLTAPAAAVSNATPTITGFAEIGSTVTISNGATPLGTVVADANGRYAFTPGAALADGTYNLTALATDPSGNVGAPSAAVTLVIDTVAPPAPVFTAGAGPTRDTTPTVSGTAEGNATVAIFNGATQIGTTVAAPDGSFSFTPGTALGDGTYLLTARATDGVGNIGLVSGAISVTVDTAAPGAPLLDLFANPTGDTTPVITGTAEPNATVTISSNGTVLGTAAAGLDGRFAFTPPVPLGEGANSLTATALDGAGNVSGVSAAVAVSVDSVAPVAPAITALPTAIGTATPTITGTAESGTVVTVFNGATAIGTVTAVNGGFSLTPSVPLPNGTLSLTATAQDAAGNLSPPSIAALVTIDTLAPNAPIFTAGAGLTRDNTPTISGTAEGGATVTIFDGATQLGTTVAASDGSFSFTPGTALADGTHAFTARAADALGNLSGTSTSITVDIDTVAPGVPALNAFGGAVGDPTPTITGTADVGSLVTISSGGSVLGTAIAGGNGAFSFTPSVALSGSLSLTATAQDPAGNVSAPSW